MPYTCRVQAGKLYILLCSHRLQDMVGYIARSVYCDVCLIVNSTASTRHLTHCAVLQQQGVMHSAGSPVALASWHGVGIIAAAHQQSMLTFHQGRLADGTLRYAQVAEVALPGAPTDLAALHYIIPTLAVGCEGRCISSDRHSWMCKLLPPGCLLQS